MDVMRVLDEIHLREPTYGQRRLKIVLERDHNITIGRERLRRLMGLADVHACHPKPRTSEPAKGHKKYPYLMRKAKITAPNQAWCTDITYIPMARGFCYLCAIMDWHSRKVLGWALSTTIDTNLCLEAYRHAVASEGCTPEIMNTDQGRQFTSKLWTDELEDDGVKISMDGKGRWVDNVFIERLWRSLKHEDIYLKEYQTPRELERGVDDWFRRYNHYRPHSALGGATPASYHVKHLTKSAA